VTTTRSPAGSGRCRKRRARARRRTPRPGAHRVPTAIFLSILTTCVLPGIPDAHVLALRPLGDHLAFD
jgi:hypothetical protein